jgi:hypothetical protein
MEPKKEFDQNGRPKLGTDGKPKILLGEFEPTTFLKDCARGLGRTPHRNKPTGQREGSKERVF